MARGGWAPDVVHACPASPGGSIKRYVYSIGRFRRSLRLRGSCLEGGGGGRQESIYGRGSGRAARKARRRSAAGGDWLLRLDGRKRLSHSLHAVGAGGLQLLGGLPAGQL